MMWTFDCLTILALFALAITLFVFITRDKD